jgi:large subunit ribosomal protein L2
MKEKKLFKPGKAGYNQIVGFKSIVRGVAMNPVDHPNGGRTKSFSGEKSPWG